MSASIRTSIQNAHFFRGPYAREALVHTIKAGFSPEEARRIVMGITCSYRDFDDTPTIPNELMCGVLGIDEAAEKAFFNKKNVGRGFGAFLAHSSEVLTKSNYKYLRLYLLEEYRQDESKSPYSLDQLIQDVIRMFHKHDPLHGAGLALRRKFWKYYGYEGVPDKGFPFLSEARHIRRGAYSAIKAIGGSETQAADLTNRICSFISMNDGHNLSSALTSSLECCSYLDGKLIWPSKAEKAFWDKLRIRTDEFGRPREW